VQFFRPALALFEERTAPASFNTLISRADLATTTETASGTTRFDKAKIVSDDGRYLAFTSTAGNVITGQVDGNNDSDVFVYDRATNTTELISRAFGSSATTGNGKSYYPTVSADGRYVVFISTAKNLISGMSNLYVGGDNVFVYDRIAQTSNLVTHEFDSPITGANGFVTKVKISDNGQTVIFSNTGSNLVAGMSNPSSYWHAYAYSVATGQIALIDHAYGDPLVPGDTFGAYAWDISADGRYVMISSSSTNLTNPPTEKGGFTNGFRFDMQTGENLLITKSVVSGKVGCNGAISNANVSADGNWISFESSATDLIAGYVGSNLQIFEYEASTAIMSLVSHDFNSLSTGGNGDSSFALISDDGRYITYASQAKNLINGFVDGNGTGNDLFLFDRDTGQTALINHLAGSNTTSGNKNAGFPGGISADGKLTIFGTASTDLIPGFVDNTGGFASLFAFDRTNGGLTLIGGRYGSSTISANRYCLTDAISADGNSIAFATPASDIISGLADLNGSDDVFVRSVATGSTVLASRRFGDPSLSPGGDSTWVQQSADGRFIVYTSTATNNVSGQLDSENTQDVFLYDRQLYTTVLVSHSYDGISTAGNSQSGQPMISVDGRYVAYYSWATNLVPNFVDTNGPPVSGDSYRNTDVYLFDRITGINTLVSHKAGMPNVGGNQTSGAFQVYIDYLLTISSDGRYVSYFSLATDLVPGFVNLNGTTESNLTGSDIFVYDRTTDTNMLVSHSAGSAVQSSNDSSYAPSISADGRYIAYWSYAYTIVNGMTPAHSRNIFICDQQTGITTLASHTFSSNTLGGNNWSSYPAISKDGNFVVYQSGASNLVSGSDSNNQNDVFLYNRQTNTNTLVSHGYNSGTTAGNAFSDLTHGHFLQSISDDGRFVVYVSGATNLVNGYVQGYTADPGDVYLFDRITGANTFVSHTFNSATTGGNRFSRAQAISGNGRFIAFYSEASNLVAGYVGNLISNTYVYDRLLGTMKLASYAVNDPLVGTGVDTYQSNPVLSYDGSVISYVSAADNLVTGDFNAKRDVFASLTPPPRIQSIQINDGSPQRSVIRSVTVNFDDSVFVVGNPFQVVRDQKSEVSSQFTINSPTSVTLTFSGVSMEFGSLADGNYELRIISSQVSGVGNLDGNGDGVGGDDYVFTFHRLFGDGNGDKRVDSADFALFRQVFGTPGIAFDFNNDGNTSATDFAEFRKRFGLMI